MDYALGKLPASNSVKLKLSKYLNLDLLPSPPMKFGHARALGDWGMLGNDQYGDCVFAGAGHETMLWNQLANHPVSIADSDALADYTAVTGFDPLKPDTDAGTDPAVAAKYRQDTGIVDAQGNRHKIAAYAVVKTGDWNEIRTAAYLFEAVGVGLKFPASAMEQFADGRPWTVVPGARIAGGHYVSMVGAADRNTLQVVTWGKVQLMDRAFFEKYCDEVFVYLSEEDLMNGKSLEGFDSKTLATDLAKLRK